MKITINKLVISTLTILLISSCSTGKMKSDDNTVKNEKEQMTGAYTKYRTASEEDISLFTKTYKGEIALKPIKVASQVVAGTNYSFICKDGNGNQYEVVIYEPLPGQGNSEVSSVRKK